MRCPMPVRMIPQARDIWAHIRKVVMAVIVCWVWGLLVVFGEMERCVVQVGSCSLVSSEQVEHCLANCVEFLLGWLVVGVVLVLPRGVVVEFVLVATLQVFGDHLGFTDGFHCHELNQQSLVVGCVCIAIADAVSCVHALACQGVVSCVLHCVLGFMWLGGCSARRR